MQAFTWVLATLVACIFGLIIVRQATWRLLSYSYDDALFMVFAILAVFGAGLIFASIVFSLGVFNGSVGIRSLDFVLLVIVFLVVGRRAFYCFLAARQDVHFISRYVVGIFCLFISLAAVYEIIGLFQH